MTTVRILLLVAAMIAGARPAAGAGLAGRVTDDAGTPVVGALVTARDLGLARETTVYADADGRFALAGLEPGTHHVRARRPGYRDATAVVAMSAAPAPPLALVAARETDPRELAWQLPANRWFPLVVARLPDDAAREEVRRQCTFCHQQGSWATRVPRDPEQWRKLFALMARMGGVLSTRTRMALLDAFNAGYSEDSWLPALGEHFTPPAAPADGTAHAVVTEWDVGTLGSMQHDLAVHPDGHVYAVDMTQDKLYRLDPRTGERRTFDIPRGDAPLGGAFATRQPIPANADAHVGPHSIQVAPDGAVWMTLALGNAIARFDPASERFDVVPQEDGLYPHTLRFDARGRVWYTLAISNQVGMYDPRTRTRRTFRLPARTWGETFAVRAVPWVLWLGRWIDFDAERAGDGPQLPIPYGIDVAPDGGIWFSQLNEQRIGRLDPESGDIQLIDTPFAAPRRLRFDSQGRLWIPGFSSGVLSRFDPATNAFKTWDLPIEPRGSETPYALNVDRRTDTVWICGTQSDTLIRFEPTSERFTVFPLPTRVTYTREIDFDASGAVWTSNSNLPAWQIEGAVPKLIRLEPGSTALATR